MFRSKSNKENRNYREMSEFAHRVTPEHITSLDDNEIFVFGSNAQGMHGGGAAAAAMRLFGAVWGQGEGLQGQSYAIPTMGTLGETEAAVARFVRFAMDHPELKFFVTRVGCGIAGYTPAEIAPFFVGAVKVDNISLPMDFWAEII